MCSAVRAAVDWRLSLRSRFISGHWAPAADRLAMERCNPFCNGILENPEGSTTATYGGLWSEIDEMHEEMQDREMRAN